MVTEKPADKKYELSKAAYGGTPGNDYVPYIPITEAMPELTGYSIIIGVLFALIFAAANTYLGLKVGLTISAGIPGAILATGLLKGLFRRNNILEANTVASLMGVGFIVGTKTSVLMFGGSVVAWLALIPLIKFLGAQMATPLFPSTTPIAEMGAFNVWSSYIRYIGAGAVATGGFISLVKSLPTLISSFKQAITGMRKDTTQTVSRMDLEAPLTWVIAAAMLSFLLTWFVPIIGGGFAGSLLGVLFSFLFAVVSGRMVGLVGASNNPVSGMTIATLLIITTVLKLLRNTGDPGIMTAKLPWTLVFIGVALAVFCFMAKIPILAVALGIYLPIGLTAAIFAAVGTDIAFGLNLFPVIANSNLTAFVMFLLLSIWVFIYAVRKE